MIEGIDFVTFDNKKIAYELVDKYQEPKTPEQLALEEMELAEIGPRTYTTRITSKMLDRYAEKAFGTGIK